MEDSRDEETIIALLNKLPPRQRVLMYLLSYLDREQISEEFLEEFHPFCALLSNAGRRIPKGPTDLLPPNPGLFRASIRSLCKSNLLKHENDDSNFEMSEKVQEVTLQSANRVSDDWRWIFSALTAFLHTANVNCYDYRDGSYQGLVASDGLINLFRREAICALFTPHVIRLGYLLRQYPERVQLRMRSNAKMQLWATLLSCSWYLLKTGSLSEARHLAEDALSLCISDTDEEQIRKTQIYNIYGLAELQKNELPEAMKWFQLALHMSLPIVSGNHPWIVALKINIAAVLVVQKEFDRVIDTLTPFATMPKADFGNLPAPSGTALFNLITKALLRLGQVERACEQVVKSLNWCASQFRREKSRVEIVDERSWDVRGDERNWDILTRNNMTYNSADAASIFFMAGDVGVTRGDLHKALRFHLDSLHKRKSLFRDHIKTAGSCYRLGDVYARLGDHDLAAIFLLQSMKIYSLLGADRKDVVCMAGLARSARLLSRVMENVVGNVDDGVIVSSQSSNQDTEMRDSLVELMEM